MAALSLSSWFKSIDPLPHRCFVSENYEVLSILFVSGSSVFLSIPIMLAEAPTPSFPNSLCVGVFSPHSSSVVHQSCSTRPEQFGQGKSDQRALKAPLSEATNSCPWPALKELHPAWTSQSCDHSLPWSCSKSGPQPTHTHFWFHCILDMQHAPRSQNPPWPLHLCLPEAFPHTVKL